MVFGPGVSGEFVLQHSGGLTDQHRSAGAVVAALPQRDCASSRDAAHEFQRGGWPAGAEHSCGTGAGLTAGGSERAAFDGTKRRSRTAGCGRSNPAV